MTPRLGGLALLAERVLEDVGFDFDSVSDLVEGGGEWAFGDGDDGSSFAFAWDCGFSADSASEPLMSSSGSIPLSLLSRRRRLELGAWNDVARPPFVSWAASES